MKRLLVLFLWMPLVAQVSVVTQKGTIRFVGQAVSGDSLMISAVAAVDTSVVATQADLRDSSFAIRTTVNAKATLAAVLKNADSTTIKNGILSTLAADTTYRAAQITAVKATQAADSTYKAAQIALKATTTAVLKNADSTTVKNGILSTLAADTTYRAAQITAVKATQAADSTYKAAQIALKVSKADSSTMPGYVTRQSFITDSTYRAAQDLARTKYSDTTSTLANQWRLNAKLGVIGYSTGDTAAFATTATRLAISVVGARDNQIWDATPREPSATTLPVAGDWLVIAPKWDSVIVKRAAGTTSGLKINYWRVR